MKKRVLFICTHNSARSQMGEGLLRALFGDSYEAYSAGTKSGTVNPYAISAMKEIGIDISSHRSKSIKEFEGVEFDYVITVCNNAKETCPFFPGAKKYIHQGFDDPADIRCSDTEILDGFRRVRDQIRNWIENILVSEKIEEGSIFVPKIKL